MKTPTWFWVSMAIWLAIGLPIWVLGSLYKGSPVPDAPPLFYSASLTDQIVGTLVWLIFILIMVIPLFTVPALLIWRRKRKRSDA